MTMLILLNDIPIALGAELPQEVRERVGLQRPVLLRRLLERDVDANSLEVDNCELSVLDGAFKLYPCTHGYLTPDRQWRTAASVVVDNDVVTSVLVRVIEGRYSAAEFVDRFREACNERFGDPQPVDRYTNRWRNGQAHLTSCLEPDGKNACFLIELLET